jgi:hypothetical protein
LWILRAPKSYLLSSSDGALSLVGYRCTRDYSAFQAPFNFALADGNMIFGKSEAFIRAIAAW